MIRARVLRARAVFLAFVAGLVAAASEAGCAAANNRCELNSDCTNAYCKAGECARDCVDSALDCDPGFYCDATARCQPVGGGEGGGASTSSSAGGGAPSDAASSSDATSSTSSSSSSSSGAVGSHELDPCVADADCSSPLLCKALVVGGPKRCTRACSSPTDCMAATRCESIGGSTYCAGNDVGRPCNGPANCNFGCLIGPGYCTAACSSGADCPSGYGCMPIGNPAQSVCVKAEAYCTAGNASACIAPSACDESPGLVVGGCTLACQNAGDCPRRAAGLTPWTCDGLCRRPADVFGPLPGGSTPVQYACDSSQNPVDLCNDHLHIDFAKFSIPAPPAVNCASPNTTDGAPGDACVDSCRYQGGCAFGFACTAVGNVGSGRIGLCLPTGVGAVGAPCANDGQCQYGYCASGKCSRDCTADGVCPSGASCVAAGGPAVEGSAFKRCQ